MVHGAVACRERRLHVVGRVSPHSGDINANRISIAWCGDGRGLVAIAGCRAKLHHHAALSLRRVAIEGHQRIVGSRYHSLARGERESGSGERNFLRIVPQLPDIQCGRGRSGLLGGKGHHDRAGGLGRKRFLAGKSAIERKTCVFAKAKPDARGLIGRIGDGKNGSPRAGVDGSLAKGKVLSADCDGLRAAAAAEEQQA